jgi:hypothetical protein
LDKRSKDILELSNATDEIDLTDICTVFHPTAGDYTFFSAVHRTFSKIDHILGYKKKSLNKYKKKAEIISCILTDHNGIKQKISSKENYKKLFSHVEIEQNTWDDLWVIEEIGKQMLRFPDSNENENSTYQNLWDIAKAVLGGKFIAMSIYIRKLGISNKELNGASQGIRKTRISQS